MQWRSDVFSRLGQLITMAAPGRSYEIKKNIIEFSFILLSSLKFVARRMSDIFVLNVHLETYFPAPYILSPGGAAPLPPPPATFPIRATIHLEGQ